MEKVEEGSVYVVHPILQTVASMIQQPYRDGSKDLMYASFL